MSWEIVFMLLLLVAMMAVFISEKLPTELTGMVAFALLLVMGLLPPSEAMAVFSNEGPIAIGAMFIISATLEKCGAIELVAIALQKLPKLGLPLVIGILVLSVALVSGFVNNTAVVIVFLPIVISLARRMETPASKLLIPLSYASIFGGSCTLVGTSTNIVVSSMAKQAGLSAFGMFELAVVGLPLLLLGTIYLVVLGPKMLPKRETLSDAYAEDRPREYIVEAYVKYGSPLVGKRLSETSLGEMENGRVLEVHRHGVPVRAPLLGLTLEPGDRLLLAMAPRAIPEAQREEGIDMRDSLGDGLEGITQSEGVVVEGIVGPDSSVIGKTLGRIEFLERFRLVPLGINRRERSLRDDLDRVTLERGDTLLLLGTAEAIEQLRGNEDILVLDKPTLAMPGRRKKLPIILAVIVAVIATAAAGLLPIASAAIVGCVVLFLTKCITLKGAYEAIHWPILFLIFSMLGVGAAMEHTGTSEFLANGLVSIVSHTVPENWRPFALLAGIYLMTTLLTEVLSNNAAAVLLASLTIGLAETMEVNPQPYLIAIALAASASFATPIGYQTNTYVYGVGGYKFADFLKIGIPLNLLAFVISMIAIPMFWDF